MDDERMNMAQRTLRPFVNWIVETFFPGHMFWGKRADPFLILDRVAAEDRRGRAAGMLAAHVVVAEVRNMGADSGTWTLSGVTSKGVPCGDWQITVERIEAQP